MNLLSACNITTGKLDSNAAVEGGIYNFFTCAPEPLKTDTYAFDGEMILLAGNNASGNFHCQRFTGKCNAYQRTYVITAKKGFDIDFLYYSFVINLNMLKKHSQGSQTKFLTMEILKNFELMDINYPKQKQLVASLTSIDKKIELNNSICSDLEALSKEVFDYWFVQFDFPNENGKPYKSSGGKMEWNETLKREIPKGWKAKPIAEAIKLSKNGDWGNGNCKKPTDIKVSCFRGADFPSITSDYRVTAPTRYISQSNKDRLLQDGDLVAEVSGGSPTQATGRVGYINQKFLKRNNGNMTCSNFCKAFTPKYVYYQYWLYQMWKLLYQNNIMFNYESKTTGIKNFMFDEFVNNVYIPFPDEPIVMKYHTLVSDYFDKTQDLFSESQELANLRDFLLPMLMNGQIKIGE